MTIELLGFGLVLLLGFTAGHEVGDYVVQQDHWAQAKGKTGMLESRAGRIACLKHAVTHTLSILACIAVLGGLFGVDGDVSTYYITVSGAVVNGITHYVIDRRWTLEKFGRLVLNKGPWFDHDDRALFTLDQSVHKIIYCFIIGGMVGLERVYS